MVTLAASSLYAAYTGHLIGAVAQTQGTGRQECMVLLEILDLLGFGVRPVSQLFLLQADGALDRWGSTTNSLKKNAPRKCRDLGSPRYGELTP